VCGRGTGSACRNTAERYVERWVAGGRGHCHPSYRKPAECAHNIEAIGGDAHAQSGVNSINSLAQVVPGLEYVDTGPDPRGGNNQFYMRGLRSDATGSQLDSFRTGTVAPVSNCWGETPIFFSMALTDLERVEVLKGPQGTLYGSGSLAGILHRNSIG
jgi:outer membrane receptor protein involved in Fe transport